MPSMKRISAAATSLALVVAMTAQPALAAGAQLEGLVLAPDRGPAVGHRVLLVDDSGTAVADVSTNRDGVYAFENLEAGAYAMAIADDAGRVAPVAGEPLRLGSGELARRDISLVEASAEQRDAAATANYGLGVLWAGLSASAKVWTIVGLVGIVAITAAAIDDDDDDDPASEFEP